MFILYAMVLGIGTGYILGGRLKRLIGRPLEFKSAAFAALLIQLVVFSDNPLAEALPGTGIVVFHLLSYLCLAAFVVKNWKTHGIIPIGAGILSNALVIFVNGGYMPTIPENLARTSVGQSAGMISQGQAIHNSALMTADTHLAWLGDMFYMPAWMPFSNVFSIGDVLIGLGVLIYFAWGMKIQPKTEQQAAV